ncbi:inositol monophosphatase family protein [Desulfovibrio sp.]|uniref:inositol monophosphatase family protein n=1 Tax=Desulfovibrio sp. TaxID=885 RepID=UPI0023BE4F8C|nr:inositol monophosphatase family protein [Desulfovibrio sp.]MDE7241205.1 inositol monophosphatase [Desulfovibrio sp.]
MKKIAGLDAAAVLEACVRLVRESGDMIRGRWSAPSRVTHKGVIDLVTDTDLAVEAFLKEGLARILPGAGFLAEESSAPVGPARDAPPCWIIDPVDGTTNFVHRLPQVSTSVALWAEGQIQLGVVNGPMLGAAGECFSALRGGGAFLNGRRVGVSSASALTDALACTGFPYELDGRLDLVLERLRRVLPATQGLRRLGSAALDLAFVAAGRLDVFYEDWLKPWDLAAGWLLVEEAGGAVSGLDGAPFRFGDALLATNGRVHPAMVELLAPTLGPL